MGALAESKGFTGVKKTADLVEFKLGNIRVVMTHVDAARSG